MTYNIHFHIPGQQGEEHTHTKSSPTIEWTHSRRQDIDPGILFAHTIALKKTFGLKSSLGQKVF